MDNVRPQFSPSRSSESRRPLRTPALKRHALLAAWAIAAALPAHAQTSQRSILDDSRSWAPVPHDPVFAAGRGPDAEALTELAQAGTSAEPGTLTGTPAAGASGSAAPAPTGGPAGGVGAHGTDGTDATRGAAVSPPQTDTDRVPLELRDPAAGKSNVWYFQTSLFTRHYHDNADHNNHQKLLNLEYWRDDGYLAGGAFFYNSFDQPTGMLYVGRRWRPLDSVPSAYLKLAAGIIHGYKGEYRDRIPFNSSGTAPILLPSIGYSGKRFSSELILFGTSGVLLTLGVFLY